MPTLFDPVNLGAIDAPNRIFMAPLTRGRADPGGVPNDLMAQYYGLRTSAGLIIGEATAVSPLGYGWRNAPGLWNDAQQAGWSRIAQAVHARGGRMFLQLFHMGFTVVPSFIDGASPLAPSAVAASGGLVAPDGTDAPFVTPRAIDTEEIPKIVAEFAEAARRALTAGFDGVEIHAANGFLLDEFLRDHTNRRTDRYGGSINNRLRFLREVLDAVTSFAAGRIGVRISPTNSIWGIRDSDPEKLFSAVADALNEFRLSYLHVLEPRPNSGHFMATEIPPVAPAIRRHFRGTLLLNGGLDFAAGQSALESEQADAVAFGTPFISNPDLVTRYRHGIPLSSADHLTFYTPGTKGYLDYPEAASVPMTAVG